METLQVRRHETIRLDLAFGEDLSGHSVALRDLDKIGEASVTWTDAAAGTAELLVPTGETGEWPMGSVHRAMIVTVDEGGDVAPWGTVEFKVVP